MCKHKCIYILVYAACKTTPKSLKHDGVWGASSPSEHIHYTLDTQWTYILCMLVVYTNVCFMVVNKHC